ncbi:xanthine dehydrogenase accessory protein XdhC [Thiomicrorhabdus hydrogeniphila]
MFNLESLANLAETKEPFVLVTVGKVQGSSPREMGAKMMVTQSQIIGTIGGGNLEFFAIKQAKEHLSQSIENQITEYTTPLTPQYDQCCGGVVQLLFEKVNPQTSGWLKNLKKYLFQNQNYQAWLITDLQQNIRYIHTDKKAQQSTDKIHWLPKKNQLVEPIHNASLPVYIFGTGHVGKAIVNQLQHLNVNITCIDSRLEQQPVNNASNVHSVHTTNWQTYVSEAPNNAYFLVLTHSHKLDYEITEAILKRNNHTYFGLIGSKTKKIRFQRQLKASGITDTQLNSLTCPIGLPSIQGKTPEIIAVSVVAQILQIQSMANINNQPTDLSTTKRNHYV